MNSTTTDSLAAVFTHPLAPFELRRFALPLLRGTEALVTIRCATLCGSDLHSYQGRRSSPTPGILGHEMIGILCALGPDGVRDFRGQPLQLGDRVTWSMVWSCGECFYCKNGLRPKCEKLLKFGHESISGNQALLGGLAEHCFLPEKTALFKVPENLPDIVASPANCATATVASAFRRVGDCRGCSIVVVGAGMLGLTACAMASIAGASHIIVLEPSEARRKIALDFGATCVLDSSAPLTQIRDSVLALTSGRGVDLCVEFSGYPEGAEMGVRLLRFGGKMVLVGATFPSRPLGIAAEDIVRRMLTLVGVYNYEPEDLETALAFLSATLGRFPFASLTSQSFTLKQVNEAFAFAEKEKAPRVAVLP